MAAEYEKARKRDVAKIKPSKKKKANMDISKKGVKKK